MEKWGNGRALGFWEASAPLHRPSPNPAAAAAPRGVADYIRAKYNARLFAHPGEPAAWHAQLELANGWVRHWDPDGKEWFYSDGTATAWDCPPAGF